LPGELLADTAAGCPVAIGAAYTALPAGFYLLFDDDVDWDYIALSDAMNGPAAGKTDFATIALHEVGHVVGLLHTPGDPANHIMRASITGDARNVNFNRTIENDSAFGAAELYTITRGIRTDTPGLPPDGEYRKLGGMRSKLLFSRGLDLLLLRLVSLHGALDLLVVVHRGQRHVDGQIAAFGAPLMHSHGDDVFARLEFRGIHQKRERVAFQIAADDEQRLGVALELTIGQVVAMDFLAVHIHGAAVVANQFADDFLRRLRVLYFDRAAEERTDSLLRFVVAEGDRLFDIVVAVAQRRLAGFPRRVIELLGLPLAGGPFGRIQIFPIFRAHLQDCLLRRRRLTNRGHHQNQRQRSATNDHF
jgi:hypothetical protein